MSASPRPWAGWHRDPLILLIAGLGCLLVASFLLALSGRFSEPRLELPWFVPAIDAFVILVTLSVATLAAGRWKASDDAAYFWTVVGSFGFALSLLFHLLTFLGVAPTGEAVFDRSAQAPARAVFVGHLVLTTALLLTSVARWPRAPGARRRSRAALVAPWLAGPLALQASLLALDHRLPALIAPDGSVNALAPRLYIAIAVGCGAGVVLSLRRYLATRNVFSAYVVISQLSLLYFAATLLFCRVTRFSLLWYSYYLSWVVGLVAVLLGLLAEYGQLYSREQATTTRLRETLSDRERMQAALSAGAERLRLMFEGIGVGIAEVDEGGIVIDANERLCRMLGYGRAEARGKSLHDDFTAPEDRGQSRELNMLVNSGEVPLGDYEKRFLRRDGTRIWVHVTIARLTDQTGRFMRAIGTVEDVTARKRAEEEREALLEMVRESDRRKDEFLGILSHELRNPLAPIRNALYVLARADPAGELATRAREIVTRQVVHLTRLVDDLLDVTRIARGRVELRREALDLGNVVRQTADDQRMLMQEAGIQLDVIGATEPLLVHGDGERIAQILGNLLHNARKFTGAGGVVTVSVVRQGAHAAIRVRDTGVGIDPELQRRLFEPFTQARQALARTQGGLGLGLALVKGLVELHDGSVSAASLGPGRGSEFTVELPLQGPVPNRA